MKKKVVAKFEVWSADIEGEGEDRRLDVRLEAVTDGSPENEEFWKYTPSGSIQMSTHNEAVFDAFKQGEEFYVTFEKAEG